MSFSHLHNYTIKHLNPWLNSSASHVVNYSQPYACPGEMEPFKEHLSSEHSWKFDKPQKQTTAKAVRVTFNINACLNCWLMCTAINWWWKVYLAVVCMEASFSLMQSSDICAEVSLPVHYVVRQPLRALLNFDEETYKI